LKSRQYRAVSDEDRLILISLIVGKGLSCLQASKIVGIPYNNAKMILRVFKNENRIKQIPKQLKRKCARKITNFETAAKNSTKSRACLEA